MSPLSSSLLNPRLSFSLKPLFLFSQSSFAPRKFQIPRQFVSAKRRNFSALASEQSSATDSGGRSGGGRSGALSPSTVVEEVQRIDVNPPKGTRDFPPEDMRLRTWLFNHFREVSFQLCVMLAPWSWINIFYLSFLVLLKVSRLFGFEEVDYPVLESEALFIRKAGEEIRDQVCSVLLHSV